MSRKKEPTYITEQQAFPQRLQRLMKEHGTTQKQLGTAIGKRPQTVSLYTTGQSSPDVDTIRAIADYYDVSADWLLGRPGSAKTIDPDVQAVCQYTGLSEQAVRTLHEVGDPDAELRAFDEKRALFDYGAKSFVQDLIEYPDKFLDAMGHLEIASALQEQIGDSDEKKDVINRIFGYKGGPQVVLSAADGIKYHRQEARNIFADILDECFKEKCRDHEYYNEMMRRKMGGDTDAVDTQDAE